jgi:hypothetical protein
MTCVQAVALYQTLHGDPPGSRWADERTRRFFVALGRWRYWTLPRAAWSQPWPRTGAELVAHFGSPRNVIAAVRWAHEELLSWEIDGSQPRHFGGRTPGPARMTNDK